MSWRTSVRTSLVYLLAIIGGFAAAYLIVAFFVFPAGIIPKDVKVPNVSGLMFDEAVQRLAQAGFKGEKGEQRYNSSAPKNTVLEQSPPPGAHEAVGLQVMLVVSGGARMVTIPTLTGLTKSEAVTELEKAGFDVGDATETASNQPRGTVIGTRPAAGAQVSIPTTVNLVISGGTATIDMPNLVGRDVEGARQTLNQLGAHDIQVVFDPMAVGAKGTVIAQSPVAGASLVPGGTITLRVAGEGTP
jgi:serine/threonine-protein kinase